MKFQKIKIVDGCFSGKSGLLLKNNKTINMGQYHPSDILLIHDSLSTAETCIALTCLGKDFKYVAVYDKGSYRTIKAKDSYLMNERIQLESISQVKFM